MCTALLNICTLVQRKSAFPVENFSLLWLPQTFTGLLHETHFVWCLFYLDVLWKLPIILEATLFHEFHYRNCSVLTMANEDEVFLYYTFSCYSMYLFLLTWYFTGCCSNMIPCSICTYLIILCPIIFYPTTIRVLLVQSLPSLTLLLSGYFPYINFSPSVALLKPITHLCSALLYSAFYVSPF